MISLIIILGTFSSSDMHKSRYLWALFYPVRKTKFPNSGCLLDRWKEEMGNCKTSCTAVYNTF